MFHEFHSIIRLLFNSSYSIQSYSIQIRMYNESWKLNKQQQQQQIRDKERKKHSDTFFILFCLPQKSNELKQNRNEMKNCICIYWIRIDPLIANLFVFFHLWKCYCSSGFPFRISHFRHEIGINTAVSIDKWIKWMPIFALNNKSNNFGSPVSVVLVGRCSAVKKILSGHRVAMLVLLFEIPHDHSPLLLHPVPVSGRMVPPYICMEIVELYSILGMVAKPMWFQLKQSCILTPVSQSLSGCCQPFWNENNKLKFINSIWSCPPAG